MGSEFKPREPPATPEPADVKPLLLSDWIWRPRYAKLSWAVVSIYWIGRMVSIKVTALADINDTLVAGYFAIFCNPLITLLLLGFGFVRAKLDPSEWVITPDKPAWQQRKSGEILDPYTDPSDPRSGPRHLRHIGVLKDGGH